MHFINSLLLLVVGNKAEQKITFRARRLIINIAFTVELLFAREATSIEN